MGNVVYSPDVLDQVIDVTDKWWSNVGEKEAVSIVLANGIPGSDAPAAVRILFMGQLETLVLMFYHYVASRRRHDVLQWD